MFPQPFHKFSKASRGLSKSMRTLKNKGMFQKEFSKRWFSKCLSLWKTRSLPIGFFLLYLGSSGTILWMSKSRWMEICQKMENLVLHSVDIRNALNPLMYKLNDNFPQGFHSYSQLVLTLCGNWNMLIHGLLRHVQNRFACIVRTSNLWITLWRERTVSAIQIIFGKGQKYIFVGSIVKHSRNMSNAFLMYLMKTYLTIGAKKSAFPKGNAEVVSETGSALLN